MFRALEWYVAPLSYMCFLNFRRTPMANREQIKELVDMLADKTLSFGCRIENHPHGAMYIAGNEGWECVKFDKSYSTDLVRKGEISWKKIGHPISLGTVLEKMIGALECIIDRDFVDGTSATVLELIRLWKPCGFTTSFQDIINESGWEEVAKANYKTGVPEMTEQLKNPKARVLAEFLISIFLTK